MIGEAEKATNGPVAKIFVPVKTFSYFRPPYTASMILMDEVSCTIIPETAVLHTISGHEASFS